MEIRYLASAARDLDWFRTYYRAIFPDGSAGARASFRNALGNLRRFPLMGHPVEETDMREYSITRTPFAIIYRLAEDHIEIVRVLDQRAGHGIGPERDR